MTTTTNPHQGLAGNPYVDGVESLNSPAQASMVLAFEQRTTNLIEFYKHVDAQGDLSDLCTELVDEITATLKSKDQP